MNEELYDTNLVQWLQLSGEHIVQIRPAHERVVWVEFLIKEVESLLPPQDTVTLLTELQGAIARRLAHGVWDQR
jgi:hypothetical protein